MSTDKIDQLFANVRNSEPYMPTGGFEEQLSERLDKLEWPPMWLRFAIPALGALIGIVCGLLILVSLGGPGYTVQLFNSLVVSALNLPLWGATLISLLVTAVSLFSAKKYLLDSI
jgi:hypothetical protein